jgi:hypothetical protein
LRERSLGEPALERDAAQVPQNAGRLPSTTDDLELALGEAHDAERVIATIPATGPSRARRARIVASALPRSSGTPRWSRPRAWAARSPASRAWDPVGPRTTALSTSCSSVLPCRLAGPSRQAVVAALADRLRPDTTQERGGRPKRTRAAPGSPGAAAAWVGRLGGGRGVGDRQGGPTPAPAGPQSLLD